MQGRGRGAARARVVAARVAAKAATVGRRVAAETVAGMAAVAVGEAADLGSSGVPIFFAFSRERFDSSFASK